MQKPQHSLTGSKSEMDARDRRRTFGSKEGKPNSTLQFTKIMSNLKLRRAHSDLSENNNNKPPTQGSVKGKISETNIMRFYCDDNNIETGTPVGFFGLFNSSSLSSTTSLGDIRDSKDNSQESNNAQDFSIVIKNQSFFSQLELTKEMFPEFPIKMLRALILRYSGNFKEIVYHLMDKGWPSATLDNLPQIINEPDLHFKTPYFFGANNDSKLLGNAPPYTYFTYYIFLNNESTIQYYVKFRNDKGTILKHKISGPDIDPLEFPLLKYPLISRKRISSHCSFFPILKFIN